MARPAGATRRAPAWPAAAAVLVVALLGGSAPACAQQLGAPGVDWRIVTDLAEAQGWQFQVVGPPQRPFPRAPPRSLDPHLLSDFSAQLNLLQDVAPQGDNMFEATSQQYIATIHSAFVEGESGLVYDDAGRVYQPPHWHFNRTSPLAPMPQRTPAQAAASCERHPGALASVVQRYGAMYYHFLEEALPRVALLAASGRLTSDVKLLTWGQPYEYQYLEMLGVSREQVVPYNASRVYCADRLLVPTPTPRITPPREALQLVRTGLGVQTLPEAQRDVIIYVSRRDEPTRRVANEDALVSAIRAAFPHHAVHVFSGELPPAQAISLFQRARLVLGPHGAGLSHILFSAPGTTVVEFAFLADPPLMFWHTAAALGQSYWMLPVPQAFWMQEAMQVPVDEVLDILAATLPPAPGQAAASPSCLPGSFATQDPSSGSLICTSCFAGSYAFKAGRATCKPCAPGRYSDAAGATACRTCQPGTYSAPDGTACLDCPAGSFSVLPGAWSAEQCLTPEQRRQQQEDQALSVQVLSKLSPVFAEQRRRLIEQGGSTGSAMLSQAELCAAQKALAGGFGDPYRGPYMAGTAAGGMHGSLGGIAGAAMLANCTEEEVVVVVLASPPAELPPVEVPSLPPSLLPPPLPPVMPPVVPQEPRSEEEEVPATVVDPPTPSPAPEVYPKKKKVVDNYVIILSCVLGGLLVLPLLAWLARRWYLARQHRKARTGASAATAPLAPGRRAFDNPAYDAEDAASDASGSTAKLSRASPL